MEILNRSYYSNRIRSFLGKGIIKVLTGQRRVGKSYLLLQLMQEIKNENPNANIVYINKEQEEFRFIRGEEELFAYLKDKIESGKENYLFIDEIQNSARAVAMLRYFYEDAKEIYVLIVCTA